MLDGDFRRAVATKGRANVAIRVNAGGSTIERTAITALAVSWAAQAALAPDRHAIDRWTAAAPKATPPDGGGLGSPLAEGIACRATEMDRVVAQEGTRDLHRLTARI
jgi:hypothetical protein